MRVFAKNAFRYGGIDYPYGWQDLPQTIADTLRAAQLVDNDNVDLSGISNFPTLADVPAGFAGHAQVGNIWLYGDGTSLKWLNKPYQRPKVASIGNSINKLNCVDVTTGRLTARSFLSWIYALSNGAFDRVTSIQLRPSIATAYSGTTAYYWGDVVSSGGINYVCIYKPVAGAVSITGVAVTDTAHWTPSTLLSAMELMDSQGNYGWSAGTSSNILSSLPIVLGSYLDTPDIVYLCALCENDFGVIPVSLSISNTQKIIQAIRNIYPKALVILSSPSQSWNFGQVAQALSDYNAYRTWVLGYSATNVFIEQNDANAYGNPINGVPNPYNTADNWNNYAASNIHVNERGACIRAKSFVSQLGFLLGDPLSIPTASPTLSPSNIAGVKGGVFNPNPDLTLTTGAGQDTIGGVTIGSMYWRKAAGNLDHALQINATGVEYDMRSTGATPGDSTHIYSNLFTASNSASSQTDVNNQSATNVTDGFFQGHCKVKVIDSTNLGSIAPTAIIGSYAGGNLSIVPFLFDNAFYAGLDGALAAGTELTISTIPFTLRDKTSFMGNLCNFTMMSTTAAAPGPKIEIQKMQIVKIG